ncbi:MAG: phosphatidylcholine/phosphatidylserine synthase [Sedimentisphaerales bacterium]|nr:phosphatidylcholine/phosphatidylserine synthase [Sedimentisphaerales bacterium]
MNNERRNNFRRRELLRRVRRQRLKTVTILPSLITLINGISGFAAICFASRGAAEFTFHRLDFSSSFAVAGYLIFIAMIADMLDGRVARMSHTTSSFGGQLDSLCDMISFGVAPAFLVLKVLEYEFIQHLSETGVFTGVVVRFIWLSGGLYMVCAAIRLARFNVENIEDETAHMSFIGLPTPGAAGVLASLVVFYQDIVLDINPNSRLFAVVEPTILYILPFATIFAGILMISRIRYPHIVNQYLKGRKPITHLTWLLVIIATIWLCKLQSALVISFGGFALVGFGRWLYFRVIRPRFIPVERTEPPMVSVTTTGEQ